MSPSWMGERLRMPRLFTKFASLGLFISKSIIEAHGGRIWAENNKEGRGATFSFSLPIMSLWFNKKPDAIINLLGTPYNVIMIILYFINRIYQKHVCLCLC